VWSAIEYEGVVGVVEGEGGGMDPYTYIVRER